jgi:hypothetical protein
VKVNTIGEALDIAADRFSQEWEDNMSKVSFDESTETICGKTTFQSVL